ncbi:MAG: cytochrome c [Flavobacteriales bacterium]
MHKRSTIRFTPYQLLAFLVLLLAGQGCTYDAVIPSLEAPTVPCDTTGAPTWSSTILPIMQADCALPGCHVPGGEGTGDYTTYAGLHAKVNDGTLIPSIEWGPTAIAMPPEGNKLSDCDIAIILRWVNAGAPNN